jgi:hypothetical protein
MVEKTRTPLAAYASWWLLLLAMLAGDNFASIDLWGKLAIPAVWLATGSFPTVEDFSYPQPGRPWTDHEWLSGLVWYAALWLGGDVGLSTLKALATGGMVWALATASRHSQSGFLWATLLFLLGLPALTQGFLATGRPQMFTFALFAMFLWALAWVRQSGQYTRLWLLLPVAWVWANLHAGFVTGAGLCFLYALGVVLGKPAAMAPNTGKNKPKEIPQRAWPFAALGVGMLLCALLNPYGPERFAGFLWHALTLPRPQITEWHAVPLGNWAYWPIQALSLLAVMWLAGQVFAALKLRRWPSLDVWIPALVLLLALWFGLRHIKHQPLLVIAAVAMLPPPVWLVQARWPKWGMPRLAIGLAVGGVWMLAQTTQPWQVQVRGENTPAAQRKRHAPYPVEALRFLAAQPWPYPAGIGQRAVPVRLWTPFSWGEFAFWVLYPRYRVSMDGRLESIYPMAALDEQLALCSTQPKRALQGQILAQSDVLLLENTCRLLPWLHTNGVWRQLYRNGYYTVLARATWLAAQQRQGLVAVPTPAGPPPPAAWPVSAFFEPQRFLPRFKQYPASGSPGNAANRP